MNFPYLVLAASLLNLVAGVILIVAGVRGRAAAAKPAKLMLAMGLAVLITNLLWGLPDFVEGMSDTPTEPTHFDVCVHNASTTELRGAVVHFLGQDIPMFTISTNVGHFHRNMKMPPPEKLAVEWKDADGTHRSQDLSVPPYPTNARRGSSYILQVTWYGSGEQTVEWQEIFWKEGFPMPHSQSLR